jgi:ADP-heptose:LPS heptosyltransferase
MLGFEKTFTFPFKYDVPNYTLEFLENSSITKCWIKFIKRSIYLFIKGQRFLELKQISPKHKSILWINISAPSLGDSLMDLSSRVLLKDRDVDLFTDKKNANLYNNDLLFSRVFTKKAEVFENKYDLIIIDSFSTKSIDIKTKVSPITSFITMFGYYNGPEVNRVLFSFHRMNQLLGYVYSETHINRVARPSMAIEINDLPSVEGLNLPSSYIAIALGGEWAYRTYNKWGEVINKLAKKNDKLNFVFVGSDNAKESAKALAEAFTCDNIFNCVAKFTFNQTAQIIKGANILLCCDGGLMHSANAVKTPIVPLFARLTPLMQLTESIQAFPLFDTNDVNNIPVEDILVKYIEATNYVNYYPQGE